MGAAVITFILCAGIIVGAYWALVVRPESSAARSLRRRLMPQSGDRPLKAELTRKAPSLSAVKIIDTLLARTGVLARPLQQAIALSRLPLTVGAVVLACVLASLLAFVALRLLDVAASLALLMALVSAPAPFWLVRLVAQRRLRQLEEQFPQAIDLIAMSLRAGHSFTTSLLIAAEELSPPLSSEFRLVFDEQNYGKPVPDVLKDFVERVPLLDARIFVTAVQTQREAGGNLAEVLDRLSEVIRERFTVRRQVRAVSAHGRLTGWILSFLPPTVAIVLYAVAPDHILTLVRDPLGVQITVVALTLQVVGTLAIRYLVRVEL